MRHRAAGILLCAVVAAAQPATDGRHILDQVVAAYTSVRGYELEATVTRGVASAQTTVAIAYSWPDRLMLEDKGAGHITSFHDHGVASFNGKSVGFLGDPRSATPDGEKTRLAAEAARRIAALVKIGFSDYTALKKGLESAKVLRQEKVTVGGDAIDCTVVEATYGHGEKRTLWVDPTRYNVLRETDQTPGEERSLAIVKLSWGERPPDNLFNLESNIHRAGVTRPVGTFSPAQAQPRCDLLTKEARIARLNGMVSMAFTVDLEGKASDIRVTGPLGLGTDDLAVECVEQSLYRPAERDGVPYVGTAKLSMGVQADGSSDWNLGRVEFHPPTGATRPIFLKANYPAGGGAVGRAIFHLSLTIDKNGVPRNVELAGGDPKFGRKAVEIASSYRFKPGESDGQPVEVPANFDLVIGHGIYGDTIPQTAPKCDVDTPETQMARLNGKISLSFTVDSEGQPGDIQVVQSLGLGTDEKAIECVAHSVHNPNGRDGKPIVGRTSAALYVKADPTYADWNLGRAAFQPPPGATRPVFLKTKWPAPAKHSNGSFRPAVFHLSLTIDKNGIPQNVQVTGGDVPALNKKAAEIVSSWRFQPGKLDDQPVDVPATFDLVVNWVLRNTE